MSPSRSESFERTMLALLPDCLAFALSLTRNLHDAEDLVQDCFLKAQRAYDSFEAGTHAKAWLFTILRRLHIDTYRKRRLRPVSMAGEDLEEMAPAPATGPTHDDPDWAELDPEALRAALESLPEPFRLAVRLRDVDGFSYRQIAEILGVPPGTVMSRLHRGREYLRRLLVDPDDGGPVGPT